MAVHFDTNNRPVRLNFAQATADFNSHRNIDHSMVDLVFKASESTVPQMEIYRYLYSRCKILLAFCWYQYFDDPNFLSEFNLSKTRGRSAIFRENNNLNEFITYGMT